MQIFFLKLFILFSFCQGLLFYFGFPSGVFKSIMLVLSINCILVLGTTNGIKIKSDKILNIFGIYIIVVFVSSILNSFELKSTISFLLYQLPSIIVFAFVRNVNLNQLQVIKLNRLFVIIFIFQILVSFFKLILFGTSEAIVGTIHYSGGSLNTIVPLVAISMLISFYIFYEKKKLFILLILGFLFMGWTGEKRGIYFYFILLITFTYYFNILLNNKIKIKNLLKNFTILVPVIVAIIYFGVRFSPTLNPEHRMGGRFDLEYLYDYTYEYSTQVDKYGYSDGRLSGIPTIFFSIMSSDILVILFGHGPNELLGIGDWDRDIYLKYGIASMIGVNGWSTALISTGIIGALIISYFYLRISIFTYKFAKNEIDPYWKAIGFGSFLITLVFFMDFFTYTRSFYHSIPLNITLLYLYGILKQICDKRTLLGKQRHVMANNI
jgi:hypothetical protein